ncbi:MAG TPA: hypothetical protein VM120_26930 [Bryobacteraceae bacterium]|nr:hypothetical protein [Bryobacteraceae bacterium]
MDSQSNRHIVQIFNDREDRVFATILAIPNYRLQPRGKTVLTFHEMPAGQPEALKEWFYPGDNFGQEFAYPKRRALEIAKITGTTVATMPYEESNTVAQVTEEKTHVEEPAKTDDSYKTEERPAEETAAVVTASPAETQVEQPAPAPAFQEETAPVAAPSASENVERSASLSEPTELPQTASNGPLAGLIGMASIFAALALRLRLRNAN